MEYKEHKIGERFKDGNTLLETVKCDTCDECFYDHNGGNCYDCDIPIICCSAERTDEEDVIFKEIKI